MPEPIIRVQRKTSKLQGTQQRGVRTFLQQLRDARLTVSCLTNPLSLPIERGNLTLCHRTGWASFPKPQSLTKPQVFFLVQNWFS